MLRILCAISGQRQRTRAADSAASGPLSGLAYAEPGQRAHE